MKENHKKLFRCYIYGYLNCYYNYLNIYKGRKNYKQKKIKEVCNYLQIGNRNAIFTYILLGLARIENYFYLFFLTLSFLKVIFCKLKSKRVIIENKYVFFNDDREINTLLKSTDLNQNAIVAINSPLTQTFMTTYPERNMLSFLSKGNVLDAYFLSVRMIFFLKKKYGKWDHFFRSYSSFDFFLKGLFLERISESNTLCYSALIDRWAFLAGNQNRNVIFIQHGIVSAIDEHSIFLKKVGRVTYAYYINDEQKDACEKFLFLNKPQSKFLKSFEFTSNDLLMDNGKLNVMLICNSFFFEEEMTIINAVGSMDKVNLYVKPHPKDDLHPYSKLLEDVPFTILGNYDFPHVDMVISNNSTLAIKYNSLHVEVVRYDVVGIETCIEFVSKRIK